MLKRVTLAIALVAAGFATGCYSSVSSTAPRDVRNVRGQVVGPYVPAGARFTVRMNDQIDTLASQPGQPFTGTVEVALTGPNGEIIVPAGAAIRGRVASTGTAATPRVRLDFESVDTVNGPARIAARVKDSTYQAYLGPPVFVPAPYYGATGYGGYGYGGYGYGGLGGYGGWGYPIGGYGIRPFGGGPYYGNLYEAVQPREVRLPQGARLELQLSRPIIPPGTQVIDRR